MKSTATRRISVLGTLAVGLLGATVQAQPPAGGNNAGNQGGNNNRPDWRNMTPEQRVQAMEQFQEQRTRGTLERYRVTDRKTQDTVVAYIKAQEGFRQPIAEQSRKLTEALADTNVTDAQLFALFNQLRTLVEAEKARTEKARATLDTLVGYSKNPRLGIALTMMGVLGDESQYFGGMMAGRGGRGGG